MWPIHEFITRIVCHIFTSKYGIPEHMKTNKQMRNCLRHSSLELFFFVVRFSICKQEQILDYMFSHLGINSDGRVEHPVVMTEPVCNPNYCRESKYNWNCIIIIIMNLSMNSLNLYLADTLIPETAVATRQRLRSSSANSRSFHQSFTSLPSHGTICRK